MSDEFLFKNNILFLSKSHRQDLFYYTGYLMSTFFCNFFQFLSTLINDNLVDITILTSKLEEIFFMLKNFLTYIKTKINLDFTPLIVVPAITVIAFDIYALSTAIDAIKCARKVQYITNQTRYEIQEAAESGDVSKVIETSELHLRTIGGLTANQGIDNGTPWYMIPFLSR